MNVLTLFDSVYALPTNDLIKNPPENAHYILYAPKAGVSCMVDQNYLQKLQQAESKDAGIAQVLSTLQSTAAWDKVRAESNNYEASGILYIIPNYKCNLSCTYCYAAKGRSSKEASADDLMAAVTHFFDKTVFHNRLPSQALRLTFMGGGEPMLSWKTVRACIETAHRAAAATGRKTIFSIITNGTILTDEMLHFITEHNIRINVSFDITPEFQQKQRGKHALVSKNIHQLLQHGVKVLVRSTITPESAPALQEIVRYAVEHFPLLQTLVVEPVTDSTLSPEALHEFLATYRQQFFAAQNELKGTSTTLMASEILSLKQLVLKHCPGSISINPELSLTACPCFSSPMEQGYQENIVGKLEDRVLKVNSQAYQTAMPTTHCLPEECHTCFARWNCAGGCVHQRMLYTPEQLAEVCRHTRLMLRNILFEKIDSEYRRVYNKSLAE